jgi:hypothetical protein
MRSQLRWNEAAAWTQSSGTMLALINGESLIGPIRIPD